MRAMASLRSSFLQLWKLPRSSVPIINLHPVSARSFQASLHYPDRKKWKCDYSTSSQEKSARQPQQAASSGVQPLLSALAPAEGAGTVASVTLGLERALRDRKTDEALWAIHNLRMRNSFPSQEHVSTLVSQLAYKQTPATLTQADRLVQDLVSSGRQDLLDQSSLSLLALAYAGVGMFTFARSTLRYMFQTGLCPSVRVWSAVVTKVAEDISHAEDALALFKEICKFTHAMVKKPVHDANKLATRAVVEADPVARIIKLMDFAMAPKETQPIDIQVLPDIVAFNAALKVCALTGDVVNADEIFTSMSEYEIRPDSTSFELLIKTYGKAGRFELFSDVPAKMEAASVKPTGSTLKALVDSYVDSGRTEEAKKLLHKTTLEEGSMWQLVKFDPDLYNNLLRSYVKQERLDDAGELIKALPPEDAGMGLSQGKVVWSMIASGLLAEAYAIVQYMLHRKLELDFSAYRSLMQGFCSNNQLDKAASFIIMMKRAGVKPDCSIYGPLIQALVRCGDKMLAYHTFLEMIDARVPPDEPTYLCLLKALTAEERASKMVTVLDAVTEFPCVKVTLFTWNLVIEYCSKKRLLGEAQRLLAKMVPSGVEPDSYTYWYVVKGLISRSRLSDVAKLWPQIQFASRKNRPNRVKLSKELVESLLYAFVKGAYFREALDLLEYAEEEMVPLEKEAFRDLFLRYHSHRFTSKHRSPLRVYQRQDKVQEMEEFKKWLKLGPVKTPARYAHILKYGPTGQRTERREFH